MWEPLLKGFQSIILTTFKADKKKSDEFGVRLWWHPHLFHFLIIYRWKLCKSINPSIDQLSIHLFQYTIQIQRDVPLFTTYSIMHITFKIITGQEIKRALRWSSFVLKKCDWDIFAISFDEIAFKDMAFSHYKRKPKGTKNSIITIHSIQ